MRTNLLCSRPDRSSDGLRFLEMLFQDRHGTGRPFLDVLIRYLLRILLELLHFFLVILHHVLHVGTIEFFVRKLGKLLLLVLVLLTQLHGQSYASFDVISLHPCEIEPLADAREPLNNASLVASAEENSSTARRNPEDEGSSE
jgi:hypothetical protein